MNSVIFGPYSPSDVTLIFSLWRTPWYVPVTQTSRKKSVTNVLDCKSIGIKGAKNRFQPSPRLLKDVKTYEDRYLDSRNTLAVMFRIERMLAYLRPYQLATSKRQTLKSTSTSATQWTVEKCLNEVVKVTKEIQKSKGYGKPHVTLDVGKYGSGSWNKSLLKNFKDESMDRLVSQAKSTLEELYDNHWSFKEWEGSFSKAARGIETSGYIAALQRTIASRADCLVLVGGGSFQDLALRGYMYNHPDRTKWCVRLVCLKDESKVRDSVTKGVM